MEWVTNNASALIAASSALLAALIAAIFSLLSTVINNRANRSLREEQFNTEKWKANRQLFIEKGEELIGLISDLQRECRIKVDASTFHVIDGGKVSESWKDIFSNAKDEEILRRIDTLINAYFPALLPDFDRITVAHIKGMSGYFQYLAGKGTVAEAGIGLQESMNEMNANIKTFKSKMSLKISEHF